MKLFIVCVIKWDGSCNTINDPYAQNCVSHKEKKLDVKEFNSMLDVNKTRLLVQHETNDCKCGLNESVCNSKENGFKINVGMSAKL